MAGIPTPPIKENPTPPMKKESKGEADRPRNVQGAAQTSQEA